MNDAYRLPYGKGKMDCGVLEELNPIVLRSRIWDYHPAMSEEELVESSLQNPIGSESLQALSVGKKKVVILASDHTRPVPSRIIIPYMLREIRRGNPNAEITILIATGCHRGSTTEELESKFGEKVFREERIVVHACDLSEMVEIGVLPSGGKLIVNRLAAEADLLVSEGFIEPHFFAGFSGGRKSVLPGIASRTVVLYNHNGKFIDSPFSRTGILENNPIHTDMLYAAKAVGLKFICNVVLNEEKKVIYSAAGDCELAHLAGCQFLKELCEVDAPEADLVVTSNGGYPLDQNLYQAVKGMTAAEAVVREHGVIIMLSQCQDGHGGEAFYKTFRDEKNLRRMMDSFIATDPEHTCVDQWQSQILARVLMKAKVVLLSDLSDELVTSFNMYPAHSIGEAVSIAKRLIGKANFQTAVIPDGVSVIVKAKQENV